MTEDGAGAGTGPGPCHDIRDQGGETRASRPGTPRAQFYRDQADAAQEQADTAALVSMAAGGEGLVIAGPAGSGPNERLVAEQLTWTLRDDPDARFCAHAMTTPVLWWAMAPGTPVSCPACFNWWQQTRIAGAAEDMTCDICRDTQPPPADLVARMLTVRFDGDGTVPGAVVIVQYGVCASCRAKEPEPPVRG
jgi:hypothetical protein